MTDLEDDAPRPHPNPRRLRRYIIDYDDYHRRHPKVMPGKVTNSKAEEVAKLVRKVQLARKGEGEPLRLLDYGSGKGYQYLRHRVHEKWGGILPHCYDPGVLHLQDRPTGLFDGVICTDVLEHIEEVDLQDTLSDIFKFLRPDVPTFTYLHVCCRPAGKHFDDGRNFHPTIKPPSWWRKFVKGVHRPGSNMLEMTFELPKPRGADNGEHEDETD